MKRFGLVFLILALAATMLLPVLMRSARKSDRVVQPESQVMVAVPNEQMPVIIDDSVVDSTLNSTPQSSASMPTETTEDVKPMPDKSTGQRMPSLILSALLGIVIVWIIVRLVRRKQPRTISYQHADQPFPAPVPKTKSMEYQKAQRPDYSLLVKQLITDNHLRPLGNHNRLALNGNISDYNVRMLLFSDRKRAENYYQLIVSYALQNPPPDFIEIVLLYIPKTIYAEKYGIIMPNENNDREGDYAAWLRNCFLTCNESLGMQIQTDHKYGELHRYVSAVFDWTILLSEEFAGSAEEFPAICCDDEVNSFPPLKMLGDPDVELPPDKPNPKGDWIGVVFTIAQFEEAFYGKASIKLLQQVAGKENLAGTVIHGGDLLPDAANWCLAIHTTSEEQYEKIRNSMNVSDETHLAPVESRILKIQNPSLLSLPYQGFFSVKGEFIG